MTQQSTPKKQNIPQEEAALRQLYRLLQAAQRICVFTGAGVSCPSGIPDFRSAKGIYSQRDGYTRTPEEMVSHEFFWAHPEEFYAFYRKKMVWPNARPNAFHRFAAALEERPGRRVTVVTQNIDGLHQAAGSTRVLELHGSVHRNRCTVCGAACGLQAVTESTGLPRCPACGGLLKPEVVLYGEQLDGPTVEAAVAAIADAELVLVAGTSLAVYPAASFLRYCRGRLAVLNLTPTPVDARADVAVYADAAQAAEYLQAMAQGDDAPPAETC